MTPKKGVAYNSISVKLCSNVSGSKIHLDESFLLFLF